MSENVSSGSVGGHLVQAGSVHGGVHFHAAATADPYTVGARFLDDVSLDPPPLSTPLRDRDRVMGELTPLLQAPDGVPHVLHGLGGCGKTTIAQALAARAEGEGLHVFWIRPEHTEAAMLWAAIELGAPTAEAVGHVGMPKRASRWAWRWLHASKTPWLLVFDNRDRLFETNAGVGSGDTSGWIRGSRSGLTLVTSRNGLRESWAPARMHAVSPLPTADSVLVLRDNVELGSGDDGTVIPQAAWDLAEQLGGVGLALRLVGRAIREYPLAVAGYEGALEHLAALTNTAGAGSTDTVTVTDGEASAEDGQLSLLNRAWSYSVTTFDADTPQALPLLAVLAVLGPDGISVPTRRLSAEWLIDTLVDNGPAPLTASIIDRALSDLGSRGLIEKSTINGESRVSMHPVVSETTRRRPDIEAAAAAAAAFRLVSRDEGHDLAMEEGAYGAILAVQSVALGAEHPDTLRTRHRLAFTLARRGEWDRAHPEYTAVLERRRRVLGERHADTLAAQRGLAWLLAEKGSADEAEVEYRKALDLHVQNGEHDHPGTARARQGLAWIALNRGDFASALSEFDTVLEVRERVLGHEHKDTLSTLLALAWAAQRQGDLSRAELLYQRVLETRGRRLGAAHPDTLRARQAVAWIAGRRGETTIAEAGLREVLGEQERVLGVDHPDTVRTRQNLAELHGVAPEE